MGFMQNEKLLFIYSRMPENDTLYVTFEASYEDGVKYITEYSRSKRKLESKRKFRVIGNTKELVENIHYQYDDTLFTTYTPEYVNIREHRNIDNNKPHKDGKYHLEFTSSNMLVASAKFLERFDKDTIINWKGKQLPALKFTEDLKIRAFFRYLPLLGTTSHYNGPVYYIKGVGLSKATGYAEESYYVHELLAVEKLDEKVETNYEIDSTLSSLPR
jgi:hypothetical protein